MYETEEQQVEAIKKWWNENGKSIVAGVVIGLGGILGWKAWVEHSDGVAAQASNMFDQLAFSVETGKGDQALKQTEVLQQEFSSTPYAGFAALMLARVNFEKGDMAGAVKALEQAIEQAPDRAFKSIAVLRLARVYIADGQLEAAEKVLQTHSAPAAFSAEYAALQGDIAHTKGDIAAARSAYQEAIANNASNQELLQLKLENLPSAPTS